MSKRLDEAEWKLDCLNSRLDALTRSDAKYGYDVSTAAGQKRLMAEAVGLPYLNGNINTAKKGDYGADPLGNGMFKMVPSGDIVDYKERQKRLGR